MRTNFNEINLLLFTLVVAYHWKHFASDIGSIQRMPAQQILQPIGQRQSEWQVNKKRARWMKMHQ